ncbi:Rhodanese-related sulfurtransferase [Gemmobacter megaterium]|uniref:Rhodanese-related sulfurtransferase n=1 Tax=Gemmobacter megaterium TaxID=1086013 RepID=A0A1N7KCH4_9RHOB|nr:rhodanese-like domain-containing protein [Gemmobacter megaterium]GGE01369.1 rhodanese-like domain-containing protein [Gemmobacter megaterium]SIS59305.1 Rhodanese-related sulfurtransferase [Gemmobacter megaterium]
MFGFSRSSRPAVGRISPKEAVARHGKGELTVIDVRDISEVRASGTASGGIHVPLMRLAMVADPRHPDHLPQLDPARPVALFCAAGGRSQMGCEILAKLGYAEVYNIGGFGDWCAGGGKVAR